MNPSFPTNPKIRLEDQIADGALFKIDSKTGHFQSDSNAVHPPKPLIQPSPGYSEAARIANFQGVLVLGVIVGRDGSPQDLWVVKKLGLGLDQKAIEMVQNWRFLPATKDGKPVVVPINIEVTFKLY
jgi:TonB family protein